MTKVVFENEGEIDVRAVTTMGVSVKSDSAIGYFGTGLKFSIATILRNGGSVTIYSGGEEYNFTAEKEEIRGKEFKIVHMNDIPLGFTTELGRDWEAWMAVREILCNCKDEDGIHGESLEVTPVEGKTIVVVECGKFTNAYRTRSEFILNDEQEPFITTPGLQVFKGESKGLFYKGVKVYDSPKPYLYTYNLTDYTQLTEDRQLKYVEYDNNHLLAGHLMNITDNEFVNNLCSCGTEYREYQLQYSAGRPCEELKARVRRNEGRVDANVPPYLAKKCKPSMSEQLRVQEDAKLSKIHALQLEKAKKFLKSIDMFTEEYPIRVMETLGDGVLGLADRDSNTIYLSKSVFDLGTKYVAGTLYEEYIHLKHGVDDETRAFQDVVINHLMTLGELYNGEPI